MRPAEHTHDRTDRKHDLLPTQLATPALPTQLIAMEADRPPILAPGSRTLVLLGAVAGAAAALVLLPAWLPALTASLLGPEPKAYWYLSRASALVSYGLLWLSMLCGLLMTNRLARVWPGGPTVFDVHQHASLLGLAFALFHALILLGDRYIQATLPQVLVPFGYTGHAPLWVGLGQIGLYGLAAVWLSYYIKGWTGRRVWRAIHFLSFALFLLALVHGIGSGTDSASAWVQRLYWVSGASVLFLTIYRVLRGLVQNKLFPIRD